MSANRTGYVCEHCGEAIAVECWLKPIPDRRFDWEAYCSDNCRGEDNAVSRGANEKEALLALYEQGESKEAT